MAPIKKKEGEGGEIEDASARSFGGKRLFFGPLTPLSLFFSIFVVIPLKSQEYVCIPQNIFFPNNEESFNK